MAPAKSKRRLTRLHPNAAKKDVAYFERVLNLNKKLAASFEKKVKINEKAQEASYAVAEIVAKKMKSHTIAETVILPACQEMVKIMFGQSAVSEISKIPLSDNTISRRIADMSTDIESNVLSKIKNRGLFALQVDESTDVSGKVQLLGFVRFIDSGAIVEDFFCCKELSETTRGQDVYDVINAYLQSVDLTWKNCVGICTDGAPAMTGNVKGFVSLVRQMNPDIVATHCFIHREALVAETVGEDLKSVLDKVVKIVNYMKMRPLKCHLFAKLCQSMEADDITLIQHTDIRWLSRGKVLSRLYELREELLAFCSSENLKEFENALSNKSWSSKVAYLADIFQKLNILNSGLQGRNENILTSSDKINAFQKKLLLWKKHAAAGNLEMFPNVKLTNHQDILPLIVHHLESLSSSLIKYFPSISVDQYDWVRNPFIELKSCKGQFTLKEEEELVSIASDRILKLKHAELNMDTFWLLVENEYPAIAEKALRLLLLFSTSYMCEFGFSAMNNIKHKKRECLLSVEEELRVCLSKIRPRIQLLCRRHQAQCSF